MTDADLDATYTLLCRTMTGVGGARAVQFLACLTMLAIARLEDAAVARDLIEAAAAAAVESAAV